jgi:diguanylate cyclase (GGDEF)-like protein/hemerythrin-like metal-binding protein
MSDQDLNPQPGQPDFEAQRKAMVDIIHRLDAALKSGRERGELESILAFLESHAEHHFLFDEEWFRSLEQMASTDMLTGAWNRRHFEEAVEGEIHRSSRYGHPLSLLFLDIDHFKRINDTFGHAAGDQVLREMASCIRGAIRLSDSLARWGGEEFLVLMPNTGLSSATALAERVRSHLAGHTFTGVGQVTASLGVAEYLPANSLHEWLDRADRAMYRAKGEGRNRVEADPGRNAACPATEHLEGSFLKLVWSGTYCCRHPLIDAQHEHLFQLANDLIDSVLSSRPVEEIQECVSRLLDEVVQHFKDEEAVLADLGFPGLAGHRELHVGLLDQARELGCAFRAGSLSIGRLIQFLAHDVVSTHMLRADREFFSLVNRIS